jgi:hypothetical protein
MLNLLVKIIGLSTIVGSLCLASTFDFLQLTKGNITYTLNKVSNPTTDQNDAYARITKAMDSALCFYNTYTSLSRNLYIVYEPSVATADGNSNGTIRFGSNSTYMVTATAMHEMGHVFGVGTTSNYKNLIVNGVFTGKNATDTLKAIANDNTAVLKGDATHFWPYGLNYASEAKSVNDYIYHARIVNAMQKDFYPTKTISNNAPSAKKSNSIYSNVLQCTLESESTVSLSVFSLNGKKLFKMESGTLPAGSHTIKLTELPLPSGNYWYKVTTRNREFSGMFHFK